jgi:putative DNA primase/helicase
VTVAKIAGALGNAHRSGQWWRARCPVHDSRGPTLAFCDGDRGLIVHCHAGCDPRDIFRELRRRGLFDGIVAAELLDPVAEQHRRQTEAADRRRRINLARDIWYKRSP